MNDYNPSGVWVIVAFAVLGIGAAIANFLKTPREQRYRIAPAASLEEQLKRYPPSAEAVIIRADRKRALLQAAPYVIGVLPPGLFVLWLRHTPHPECERLLDVNAAYLSMLLICYGVPIGVFIASLSWVGMGMKAVRTGYFPPLDSALLADTIVRKSIQSRLRGAALLALPLVALYLVSLGNDAYAAFTGGKSARQITERLESKCR